MKDILVMSQKLKEGKFEKFMGFMQSEQGLNERRKIADLTKKRAKQLKEKEKFKKIFMMKWL